ncbi:MAG: peptidoglycan DD-metalloendopeptidase family protein [Armatimonadetes bacterium]|nr:peptidoglycan DD-metalloendopeptidase family protein [Armatimonadota bacterium]
MRNNLPGVRSICSLLILTSLLIGAAFAEEVTTSRVPAVVEKLQQEYGVTAPTPTSAAQPAVYSLEDLVELNRRNYPGTWVTSGFYDWRTVSKYRTNPGLHLGYDIAMPYGAPVSAAWSGIVVAVTPWYGSEYGVTVEAPDGTRVTYGHISPTVSVGASIAPGQIIGTIASDHVDVKMRDEQGNYVAFGSEYKSTGRPWNVPVGSREELLVSWLVARNTFELTEEQITGSKASSLKDAARLKHLKASVPEKVKDLKLMEQYAAQGLVARRAVEEARQELQAQQKELATLGPRVNSGAPQQNRWAREREAARSRVAHYENEARRRGLSWADVETFVNQKVVGDGSLKAKVQAYKSSMTESQRKKIEKLKREVAEGRTRLATLEDLYKMGGLPRREIDAARKEQSLLEQELKIYQSR